MLERLGVRGFRIIRRVLILAFLIEAAYDGFSALYTFYVFPFFLSLGGFGGILWSGVLSTPLFFLISPVLLLYVFYREGKKHNLRDEYVPLAGSLFLGGLLAGVFEYLVLTLVVLILSGYHNFSFPLTVLLYADIPIVLGVTLELLFSLVGKGLTVMFAGFFAIALADLRRTEPSTSQSVVLTDAEPEAGPSQSTQAPELVFREERARWDSSTVLDRISGSDQRWSWRRARWDSNPRPSAFCRRQPQACTLPS